MGDEERADQPRPEHPYPPLASEVSGEIECAPTVIIDDAEARTPPPIVVDDIGRPVVRTRSDSPAPAIQGRRDRKTIQEVVEQLWPSRKALPGLLEQLQRIVILETEMKALKDGTSDSVAAAQVAGLRSELVGADGEHGVVGALADRVERDLSDHRRSMADLDARATKADRFVRRFLYAVGTAIAGSIVGAVLLVYASGQSSVRSESKLQDIKTDIEHRTESLNKSLTEIRYQVKLLLEHQLGRKP